MDKLPSTIIQHSYEYDNTYKIKFDKVLNQLSARIFIYRCSECPKEWNTCFCYCKICRTYLGFCHQVYFDQDSLYEDDLNDIIQLGFDLKNCEYIYIYIYIYIHSKAMAELRKCSRCRSEIKLTYFGSGRKGEPYKTCDTCRNKKKQIEVKQEICKDQFFLEYYVNLPIFKFESKQEIDIHIDSIVVLNHNVELRNNIILRIDGETWIYKAFTELDPVDYYEGTDPEMEYMPDEYAAPVLVKANGVTHRASMLTWFPLTDLADAIKWKQHVTNTTTYPIHIFKKQNFIYRSP